jgi:serine/threonine protein kinase/tetratricopeptide (TPR) repeat protein
MGPFDLIKPVGRGAMGEVWRAWHRAQGADVAIKLLYGSTARDSWALEAFGNEVRAAAGMNHPGIVMVLDHGQVPARSQLARDGRFAAGTPYLVMELVRGRPMNRFIGRLRWVHVRDVLLQLLDALAHAHARGLVHRDIKPGNVLLRHADGRIPQPAAVQGPLLAMLTDFGLAQALDRHSSADAVVAGTPAYMAPEQLEGRWRDQGPWTDLYSVGCLAWSMITGEPPFGKERPFEDALYAHLHTPPPSLHPTVPVPPGVEFWLRKMLAKDRRDRYPRAADAAWALARVSGSSERIASVSDVAVDPEPTDEGLPALQALDLKTIPAPLLRARAGEVHTGPPEADLPDELEEDDLPTEVTERPSQAIVVAREPEPELQEDRRTPFPNHWRRPRPPPRMRHLTGVGLNLFGLRPPPMVGRRSEATVLWQELREVRESGRGRVVVLRGPAGCGRTRLGTWLCERADEVGAARVLAAVHDEELGPGSGLAPMVSRFLRCDGLDGEALEARVAALFPEGDPLHDDVGPVCTLLSSGSSAGPATQLPAAARAYLARERFSLLRRLVEREASEEHGRWSAVVVMWIDDVHLGQDALRFCRFLMDRMDADPLPVLILLSAQDEGLAAHPDAERLLDQLCERDEVHTLPIGPLGEADHLELVRALLGMESSLVEQVASRTAGSPQFAVQLVGDWVQGGLLVAGDDGFRLREGAEVSLPQDIARVWEARVSSLMRGLPPPQAAALELAALIGTDVRRDEWQAAAERAGVEVVPGLVTRLLEQSLASPRDDGGFSFRHTMLRDALERRARDGGREAALHRACAAMLEAQGADRPGVAERLGRHLLGAGQVLPALGKLLEGAEERLRGGDPAAARRLLDYRERALTALQIPQSDELWGLGWLLRVEVDLQDSRAERLRVEDALERLERAVAAHRWPRVAGPAASLRGVVHLRAGRYDDAVIEFGKASSLAEVRGDAAAEARAQTAASSALLRKGMRAQAQQALDRALALYEGIGSGLGRAQVHWCQGRLDLQRGQWDGARTAITAARAGFEAAGASFSAAECINGLGDLERLVGDTDAAERLYREAMGRMDAIGHPSALVPRVNLGLVLVLRGDLVEARRLIENPLRGVRPEGNPVVEAAMRLVLLKPVAHAGEWNAWDDHLSRASAILSRTRFVDPDNALLAELGAEEALLQGHLEAAQAAFGLAWQQLHALGRADETARIEARVAGLAGG